MLTIPTTITRDGTPTSLLNRAAQRQMERAASRLGFTLAIRFTPEGNLAFTTIIPLVFAPFAETAGYTVDRTQTFDRWQDARDHEIDLWRITVW